jgi:hypothetical protein
VAVGQVAVKWPESHYTKIQYSKSNYRLNVW